MSALPSYAQINPGLTESPFPTLPTALGTLVTLLQFSGTVTNSGMGTISSSPSQAFGIGKTFTPKKSGNVIIIGSVQTGVQASQSETTIECIMKLYYGTGSSPSKASDISMATGATQVGSNQIVGMILAAAANTWSFYGASPFVQVVTGLAVGTTYWVDYAVAGANAATDAWQGAQVGITVIEY